MAFLSLVTTHLKPDGASIKMSGADSGKDRQILPDNMIGLACAQLGQGAAAAQMASWTQEDTGGTKRVATQSHSPELRLGLGRAPGPRPGGWAGTHLNTTGYFRGWPSLCAHRAAG